MSALTNADRDCRNVLQAPAPSPLDILHNVSRCRGRILVGIDYRTATGLDETLGHTASEWVGEYTRMWLESLLCNICGPAEN